MSAYEQKIEPPDKKWQYLLFAAEPYETIAFKIPSREVDKSENKFWSLWNKDTKEFFLQFAFRPTDSQRGGRGPPMPHPNFLPPPPRPPQNLPPPPMPPVGGPIGGPTSTMPPPPPNFNPVPPPPPPLNTLCTPLPFRSLPAPHAATRIITLPCKRNC